MDQRCTVVGYKDEQVQGLPIRPDAQKMCSSSNCTCLPGKIQSPCVVQEEVAAGEWAAILSLEDKEEPPEEGITVADLNKVCLYKEIFIGVCVRGGEGAGVRLSAKPLSSLHLL